MGADERLSKAHKAASDVLEKETNGKEYEAGRLHSQVFADAKEFAAINMSLYFQQFPAREKLQTKYISQQAEFLTVKEIRDFFDKGGATLVVLDGAQYITQTGETVQNYTDDTLPYHMRMKLGMLKLVEDKQMISDVGCRVDSTTYVVTAEKVEKEQA